MADVIASKILLPDDTSNTGKKLRTQTRVVGSDTVHEHFFIPTTPRSIKGIYNFGATLYTVTVGAQNGTSAAIAWLQNPAVSTINMRLRYLSFVHTNNAATAIDEPTAPRIVVQRAFFVGTPTGAVITPAKRITTDASNQGSALTASTGLTIALITNAIMLGSMCPGNDITTSQIYNSFHKDEWKPIFEDEFIEIAPGECLAIFQVDAGTTSDQRRVLVNGIWDEVDIT